jgi:hypothetical protein
MTATDVSPGPSTRQPRSTKRLFSALQSLSETASAIHAQTAQSGKRPETPKFLNPLTRSTHLFATRGPTPPHLLPPACPNEA